jgi:hypothetical protein
MMMAPREQAVAVLPPPAPTPQAKHRAVWASGRSRGGRLALSSSKHRERERERTQVVRRRVVSQPGPLGQFAAPEARRHRPRVPLTQAHSIRSGQVRSGRTGRTGTVSSRAHQLCQVYCMISGHSEVRKGCFDEVETPFASPCWYMLVYLSVLLALRRERDARGLARAPRHRQHAQQPCD